MKILQIFRLISAHACIVLALCFITFNILDWYNPLMGFTTNALSTKLMIAFCAVSMVTAVGWLISERKTRQEEADKRI